ncbi:3-keto-disaccharide hydrolase [Salegentibacter sp. F14]
MKKTKILLVVLCMALLGCKSESKLFNGKNLDGWQVYGTEKWYVEDGLLVAESGPDAEYGYLATNKEYKDFELELEFLQEADGNSGVFFRSDIEGTKISGWQVEVAPPDLHTGGVYESYGRGWLIKPEASKESVLNYGDWNKMKIRVEGDQVQTWLNGKEMVNFSDEKIGEATGKIALQIHDGGGIKVFWRNIKLRELKD